MMAPGIKNVDFTHRQNLVVCLVSYVGRFEMRNGGSNLAVDRTIGN